MKILMLGLTPPIEGGSQRHLYEVSSRIPCQVLTQKGSICKNKIELPILKESSFLVNVSFFLSCLIYSIKLLLIKRHELIHIHENLLYLLIPVLRLRYKIVVTVHGITGFKFFDNKFLWFFFASCLKAASLIISVSVADKKLLDKQFKKVIYIPNGVNIEDYKGIKARTENKIVFVGRIHEQKGIFYLLKAFEKVKNKIPGFKLVILAKLNDYSKILKKQFPDKRIIWKGFILDRKKLFSEMASSCMLIYPSLWEALPWPALLEGLASGRPVIASSLPGMNEIFSDKEIILIEPKNSEKLAEKILYLYKNKKKAQGIGKQGKKKAQKYNWGAIAKKIHQTYNV